VTELGQTDQRAGESYRILLVEGDAAAAMAIGEGLRAGGRFAVEQADRLAAALDRLDAEPFDGIVLDLDLPDSRGLDTLPEVLGRAHVPIVVLTGPEGEAAGLQAIRLGAQDHLVRNETGDGRLARSLRYAIERWRFEAAVSSPLVEAAPVGLAALDRDLCFLYVNQALAAMDGLPASAHLGQRLDRLVPEVGSETMALLERVVASGEPIREAEIQGHAAALETGTWLLNAEAMRDASGETVGLIASVVEITERKHREEALAALADVRRQAQTIGESVPFGIWIAEPDGRMRYLSESFLSLIGMTMAQARNFGWMEALAPDMAEPVMREWQECIVTRQPWNYEFTVLGADGRHHTVLSRGNPVHGEDGRVTSWAGINLDITDRREAEAFREAFTGILSHELGTPVTAIYAASTLLRRPGADAQREELLEDIGHETERLRRLVEDLVVLARAERGTIQVHTEPLLLQRILPKVCEQEQARWPDRRIELSVVGRVPVARAEEAFVAQVARGLIGNAAKYSPAGSLIKVVLDAVEEAPRLRVLDEGPGVDPAEADRLFELFYRSDRTARVAGSGIGLFVAHRLVESMGGSIWARPRDDGPGAEFGFRLQPLTEDAP
jgi:PAS domain S-box-containing protein